MPLSAFRCKPATQPGQPSGPGCVAVAKVSFLGGASSRCLLFSRPPKATAPLQTPQAPLAATLQRSLGNHQGQGVSLWPRCRFWVAPGLGCCVSLFWLLCFFYFFVSRLRCPTCQLCSGHGFPAGVLCLLRMRPNNCDDQTTAWQAGHLCGCCRVFALTAPSLTYWLPHTVR